MPLLYNRVKFTTSTTGTGTLTVGPAVSGFRTPAQASIPDGTKVSYSIEDGTSWETGRGVYTVSGTTLSRGALQSSNSDAAINLSGSAVVMITVLAEDIPYSKPYVEFAGTTTTAGQDYNRTSAGSYTHFQAMVEVQVPILLHKVYWDLATARTWNLKIYRGWGNTAPLLLDAGDKVTTGREADVAWDCNKLYIPTGGFITLYLAPNTSSQMDDNTANTWLAYSFYRHVGNYYGNTWDSNYSHAYKLEAYLGTEKILLPTD